MSIIFGKEAKQSVIDNVVFDFFPKPGLSDAVIHIVTGLSEGKSFLRIKCLKI